VGTYNDALSGATGTGLGNYTISYVNGALTIAPRLITVTADNLARDSGVANPALTYRITSSSLVGGDNFTGGLFTSAGSESEAGTYAISQGSLALSANYALTVVPGTLTIRTRQVPSAAVASVTANALTDERGGGTRIVFGSATQDFLNIPDFNVNAPSVVQLSGPLLSGLSMLIGSGGDGPALTQEQVQSMISGSNP
jgi:hypothetical protein